MIIKKEAAFLRQPHFNLNLIVDRPDGLIKERKKSYSRSYLMSSGKNDAISIIVSNSAGLPCVITF